MSSDSDSWYWQEYVPACSRLVLRKENSVVSCFLSLYLAYDQRPSRYSQTQAASWGRWQRRVTLSPRDTPWLGCSDREGRGTRTGDSSQSCQCTACSAPLFSPDHTPLPLSPFSPYSRFCALLIVTSHQPARDTVLVPHRATNPCGTTSPLSLTENEGHRHWCHEAGAAWGQ